MASNTPSKCEDFGGSRGFNPLKCGELTWPLGPGPCHHEISILIQLLPQFHSAKNAQFDCGTVAQSSAWLTRPDADHAHHAPRMALRCAMGKEQLPMATGAPAGQVD